MEHKAGCSTICVDPELYEQSEKLFLDLGMSLKEAVETFLKAAVARQSMPLDDWDDDDSFEELDTSSVDPEAIKLETDDRAEDLRMLNDLYVML